MPMSKSRIGQKLQKMNVSQLNTTVQYNNNNYYNTYYYYLFFLMTDICIYTVPLKGKLTVTRESRNSTRDSILDPRKFRESSLELSFATRELSLSSFESRKIMSLMLD